MARLTIEECWWTDPRRERLAKLLSATTVEADAAAIRMWRLAQEFWGRGHKLVPTHIFESLEAASKLIEANLATVQVDGIYVRGSSQYLDWLNDKRAAGAAGGKKSVETRRKKSGTAQPKRPKSSKQTRSRLEAEPKHAEPSGFGSDSDSVSDSGSDSGSGSDSQGASAEVSAPIGTNEVIAHYCDKIKERYRFRPIIRGKEAGQLRQLVKDVGKARAIELITSYLAMPEKWYVTKRHDVTTLLHSLNAIEQFAATGTLYSQREINQLDRKVANSNLMAAVERGEI